MVVGRVMLCDMFLGIVVDVVVGGVVVEVMLDVVGNLVDDEEA